MAADEAVVGRRLVLQRLLKQPEEKKAASLRAAAIESEGELVEIIFEMRGVDGTMVDAQPPPIKEAGHAMDAWHDDVSGVATGGNGFRLVVVALFCQAAVGRPAIGSDRCAGCYRSLNKWNQALRGRILDAPHPDAAGTAASDFRGDHDDRLGFRLSPHNAGFSAAYIGFIHLDISTQNVTPWPHHGAPQLMEPSPGRLIATQTKNALYAKRTDPVFLVGHVPHRLEPQPQWLSSALEDRSCRCRCLTLTPAAPELTPRRPPRVCPATRWAPETFRPAHTPKKIRASYLCREPFVEFRQGSGVVGPSNGMGRRACHPNILPLRERSGYPVLVNRVIGTPGSTHACRDFGIEHRNQASNG